MKFDLDHFHTFGYTSSFLDPDTSDAVQALMHIQEWTQEVYNPPNAVSDSWVGKNGYNHPPLYANERIPQCRALYSAWDQVVQSGYFKFFTDTWGAFNKSVVKALRFSKGDALGWHYDLDDHAKLLNLVYFTGEPFTRTDGGHLSIGRCKVDEFGLPEVSTIELMAEFIPQNGLIVTIDNTNPKILHKVEKLISDKERFVLSGKLGWQCFQ